jgi:hypothetical protein
MKEIVVNAGGRRLHNEDLIDMQEHLISLQNIFAGEEPFIISGITPTNTSGSEWSFSAGVLWIGGKIRLFSSQTVDVSTNPFIITSDTTNSRLQEDGETEITNQYFEVALSPTSSGANNSIDISDPLVIRRYQENVLGDKYLQKDVDLAQTVIGRIIANGGLTTTALTVSETANILGGANISENLYVALSATIDGNILTSGAVSATLPIQSATSLKATGSGFIESATTIAAGGDITSNAHIIASGDVKGETISVTAADDVIKADGKLNVDTVQTASITDSAVTNDKIASSTINEDRMDLDSFVQIPRNVALPSGANNRIKTAAYEIGNWNMDLDREYSVPCPDINSGDRVKVLSVSAMIFDDNLEIFKPLNSASDYWGGWDTFGAVESITLESNVVTVNLERLENGIFDNNNYDSATGGVRGWIYVTWMA